jgi:hypothetical protein
VQRLATRDDHTKRWAGSEQLGNTCRGLDHLLEVVHQDKE